MRRVDDQIDAFLTQVRDKTGRTAEAPAADLAGAGKRLPGDARERTDHLEPVVDQAVPESA